jgi:hypothetical protein
MIKITLRLVLEIISIARNTNSTLQNSSVNEQMNTNANTV